ncbi:MAG: hypothetical protein IH631_06775 [Candidatus Thorarchaeota archaeon]|nr:hypothetical protein [Candidatus Thorarchaeota archaeon]
MITKKQFTLLFCVFLFAAVAYQTQPVEALPFDNEYDDTYIVIDDYDEHSWALTTGDVISGYFETDDNTMGLDFFICDAANFTQWVSNGTGTGYEINTDMHTLGFEWTVTYDDTWYIVLSNVGGSSNVWVDYAIDINGDNTPFYDTSTYDYTGYGDFLETDDYTYLSLSLVEGAVIDGHFSTFFATDELDFFICDASNYDDFDNNGYTATEYSTETEMHLATIDTFTVPSTGIWYLVFYNNGQTDTITYSYGIEIDNSNTVTGIGLGALNIVGLIAGLLILLILCCVCRSKKKAPGLPPTHPTYDHYVAPPSTTTIREREIVRDRVLVICPYCGSKNEQGITTCANCDAEL